MRFHKVTIMAAALATALTACGRADDEFTDSVPDIDALALEISNAAAEGVSEQGLEGQQTQGVGAVPEYLQAAREGLRNLNQGLRRRLAPVVELIRQNGRMEAGQVRVYGPRDQDGATWKLTIRKVAAGRFAWKAEAKPVGSEDTAYLVIMAGGMQRGLEPHRGRGVVGVNLDNLKTVLGSTDNGEGKLLAAFANHEDRSGTGTAKSLAYLLDGFTPDSTQHEPVDAAFVGHKHLPSGATGVRLLAKANLGATATTAKENVAVRVRWLPGVGGAGAIRAWGGDIPEGTWYRGFGCWDAQEQEGFKTLQSCTLGAGGLPQCTPVDGYPVGQLSNCRQGLAEQDVPVPEMTDVNSTAPESGAPTTDGALAPPETMPSGDGF